MSRRRMRPDRRDAGPTASTRQGSHRVRSGGVVGILQARIGSTRLPGKVLKRLAGKTILAHCVDRMRESRVLDEIVVAVPEGAADEPVAREARRVGAICVRGPELDVLERYLIAARHVGASVVVRVTADNPLTAPSSLARVVRALQRNNWDYSAENGLPCGAASEAIRMTALERIGAVAMSAPHREHVTLYLKENPALFRAGWLDAPASRRAPLLRVTVDTAEDLAFLRRLVRLGALDFRKFRIEDLIGRLRALKRPGLRADKWGGVVRKDGEVSLAQGGST